MRKNFQFNVANHKPERQLEAIRAEIKKYLARERRKQLPEGMDRWVFDCKIGETEAAAEMVAEVDIKPMINQLASENKASFYLEIIARADRKAKS